MSKLKANLAAVTGIAVGLCTPVAAVAGLPGLKANLLIAGGLVYNGDETPPVIADLAINGDRIVFVGDAIKAGLKARRADRCAWSDGLSRLLLTRNVHPDDELASSDPNARLVARQVMQGVTNKYYRRGRRGNPRYRADVHADGKGRDRPECGSLRWLRRNPNSGAR